MAAGFLFTVIAGVAIGCGGGGGGSNLTSSTNATASTASTTATATATTATATATTATATATTATATATTATGTTAQGVFPPNVIIYGEATAEGAQLRYISPDGSGDQLYAGLSQNVLSVGLDPTQQNVKVFSYQADANSNVGLMRNTTLSGEGATELLPAAYRFIEQIQVSPDGQTVYFIAGLGESDAQLLKVSMDGGEATVVDLAESFHINQAGTQIAYSKFVNGNEEIFTMNLAGTPNPVRRTFSPLDDTLPQWSKDGTKIVFASNRRNANDYDLYTMNADGSGTVALTATDDTIELGASYNEAGDTVAYAALGGESTGGGLYTIPTAGGGRTSVKPSDALLGSAYWTTAGGRGRTSPYGLTSRLLKRLKNR
jgi:hypothetical protein